MLSNNPRFRNDYWHDRKLIDIKFKEDDLRRLTGVMSCDSNFRYDFTDMDCQYNFSLYPGRTSGMHQDREHAITKFLTRGNV